MERLGLVIIDEQHKFGVTQREQLVRKGRYPHLLVMTATPIPRTLGLTVYGDLDCSIIDQLPAGRGTIRTHVRTAPHLEKVHRFVRTQLDAGRQAYVVFPRVEEGDAVAGIKAVTQERNQLAERFAPHRVGMLHGRMAPEEKEAVMADFRANRVQVLLATTVIEVGVDVPNASVMLIENADSFGLAQLHQLRGRIGRGAHESHCILMQSSRTAEARERLAVMASTTDGFEIAEADLRIRGPGDLVGQDQSGLPGLKFGNLVQDRHLIEQARTVARAISLREAAVTGTSVTSPAVTGHDANADANEAGAGELARKTLEDHRATGAGPRRSPAGTNRQGTRPGDRITTKTTAPAANGASGVETEAEEGVDRKREPGRGAPAGRRNSAGKPITRP
jgi:ATP-dependent DNA helicase RecG